MADTSDLGSDAARPGGSSPPFRIPAPARLAGGLLLLLAVVACAGRRPPLTQPVTRQQVAGLARQLVGLPYAYGGSDIDGFDCSGLVHYVYGCFGIDLPRSAREQARLPGAVGLRRAGAGDILVFRVGRQWHSALYLGAGRFVHAPSRGAWTREEPLSGYWLQRLKAVIAVLPPR